MSEHGAPVNSLVGLQSQTPDGVLVQKLGLTQPFPSLVAAGKPLRDFQLTARHKGLKSKRVIYAIDKGLGKTLTVLSIFESEEAHKNIPGYTVLILCPEKGIGSWLRDIKLFPEHADKFQVILGSKHQRKNQWRNSKARYFICTVDSFLSDAGLRKLSADGEATTDAITPSWVWDGSLDALVFDEFHRKIRRHQSTTFKLLSKWVNAIGEFRKRMKNPIERVVLMSGSAISKGPEDVWPALHILDPKLWSSYWKYVYTWCEVSDGIFGKQIIGPKADRVVQWANAVSPYIFMRTKEMVGSQMPPFNRLLLDVEMPKWQKDLHDQMLREGFTSITVENEDGDQEERFIMAGASTLSRLYKVRLALICPKALDPSYDYGQGIEDIYETNLESEITQYLVCTPFKKPIPYLAEYLSSKGARVWTLQGGIGLPEQERRIAAWRASLASATPDKPSVIISTTKYAESWEVPEASYGYSLGYEWDPEDNKQAEARIHRLSSQDPVFWYYVRHLGAYDEDHLQLLTDKAYNRELTWSVLTQRIKTLLPDVEVKVDLNIPS